MSKPRFVRPTPSTAGIAEPLLTTEQAAAVLGFHPSFLAKSRLSGSGPTYLKLGPRAVRYRRSDIDAWLSNKARVSTSGDAATR